MTSGAEIYDGGRKTAEYDIKENNMGLKKKINL